MAGPASHRIVTAFTCVLALAGLLCASPQQGQDTERERRRMVEDQIQSRGVRNTRVPVSYTHLTLPTILRV